MQWVEAGSRVVRAGRIMGSIARRSGYVYADERPMFRGGVLVDGRGWLGGCRGAERREELEKSNRFSLTDLASLNTVAHHRS